MRLKCHDCGSEFDEKYVVYFETPGNPKCPLCKGTVAGVYGELPDPPKFKEGCDEM